MGIVPLCPPGSQEKPQREKLLSPLPAGLESGHQWGHGVPPLQRMDTPPGSPRCPHATGPPKCPRGSGRGCISPGRRGFAARPREKAAGGARGDIICPPRRAGPRLPNSLQLSSLSKQRFRSGKAAERSAAAEPGYLDVWLCGELGSIRSRQRGFPSAPGKAGLSPAPLRPRWWPREPAGSSSTGMGQEQHAPREMSPLVAGAGGALWGPFPPVAEPSGVPSLPGPFRGQ
ncbi:acetylcholinesterase collagenic tail peptide-like [Vidua macroura]|uniref:acetylcholinesterase collagenic tail peptide-like n=1 Tax=Vidua macroura TaxID=187451 RepID=UPI0023A7B864|nr:acetylcholinesterase collagenic tail peptide-like [Vidua macroura]